MASQGHESHQLHNPMFLLDGLYCEEEHFEQVSGSSYGFAEEDENCNQSLNYPLILSQHDLFWDDDEIASLLSKEKESTLLGQIDRQSSARREAVEWILRVKSHYGFTAMTTVLAVNYFDRFFSSYCSQNNTPWMGQLAAVACLSLAAKVEEIQAPLLLDLQVEDAQHVFEAKTIQRMELLVLSSLHWKMHPVTPLSFFDHITRRIGLKTPMQFEILWRCERLILCVIVDSRFTNYLPSVLATATMLHVIKEVEHCCGLDYEDHLMDILNPSKDEVDDCCKLIQEVSASYGFNQSNHKRKFESIPGSPIGVIDAYFSCDSSNDSWVSSSMVSSSPEPLFKKSRAQEQQMRLAPSKPAPVDVLSNPR